MEQLATKVVVAMLNGYKRTISPLLPPACRYVPTCSDFAVEAVERHGVLRGIVMTVGRVLRCHPLAKGGYDPVRRAEPRNCLHAGCALPVPNRYRKMLRTER